MHICWTLGNSTPTYEHSILLFQIASGSASQQKLVYDILLWHILPVISQTQLDLPWNQKRHECEDTNYLMNTNIAEPLPWIVKDSETTVCSSCMSSCSKKTNVHAITRQNWWRHNSLRTLSTTNPQEQLIILIPEKELIVKSETWFISKQNPWYNGITINRISNLLRHYAPRSCVIMLRNKVSKEQFWEDFHFWQVLANTNLISSETLIKQPHLSSKSWVHDKANNHAPVITSKTHLATIATNKNSKINKNMWIMNRNTNKWFCCIPNENNSISSHKPLCANKHTPSCRKEMSLWLTC